MEKLNPTFVDFIPTGEKNTNKVKHEFNDYVTEPTLADMVVVQEEVKEVKKTRKVTKK